MSNLLCFGSVNCLSLPSLTDQRRKKKLNQMNSSQTATEQKGQPAMVNLSSNVLRKLLVGGEQVAELRGVRRWHCRWLFPRWDRVLTGIEYQAVSHLLGYTLFGLKMLEFGDVSRNVGDGLNHKTTKIKL